MHQDKFSLEAGTSKQRHVEMNSRRLRAQRLPGACCKPFPPSPQLYPVKSPSVSSRAGNRRSYLLPKQPCSIACLLHGLHLPLLWDPPRGWGCSQAEHTLLPLSTRAASAEMPRKYLSMVQDSTHWPCQEPASFLAREAHRSTCNFPSWAFGDVICCTLIP